MGCSGALFDISKSSTVLLTIAGKNAKWYNPYWGRGGGKEAISINITSRNIFQRYSGKNIKDPYTHYSWQDYL